METPIFSIITACKDAADSITRTVESVRNQNFEHYEHLVIDGASQDSTLQKLEAQKHSRLRIKSEPDRGISDAFNKGVNESRGKWILILNAGDELFEAQTLQKINTLISAERILTGFVFDKDRNGPNPKKEIENSLPLHLRALIHHQATFTHRSIFEKYGLFDENFKIRMDYDFWLRVLQAEKFKFVNCVVAKYESGMSAWSFQKFYDEEKRANLKNLPHPLGPNLWIDFKKGTRIALECLGIKQNKPRQSLLAHPEN